MARSLIGPALEYESSYRDFIPELGNEERYPFPLDFDHSDFPSLIARLTDFEAGRNLPAGYVASSTYWFVEAGEILGVSNLRHTLNQRIRRFGGHIGLGIRPSRRGQGLGAELMSLTIQEAWKQGIDEAHIHCYKSNPASAKIIEANGGVLHSEIEEGALASVVQRFVVRAPNNGFNSDAGKAGAG